MELTCLTMVTHLNSATGTVTATPQQWTLQARYCVNMRGEAKALLCLNLIPMPTYTTDVVQYKRQHYTNPAVIVLYGPHNCWHLQSPLSCWTSTAMHVRLGVQPRAACEIKQAYKCL